MKTQASKKLVFSKKNITELNDINLNNVMGGTTTSIPDTIICHSVLPPMDTSIFCRLGENQ